MFPVKIMPSEKKSLIRPSSAAARSSNAEKPIRRISFPGRPREKEVRFTLSRRRSSNLKILSDAYDPASTSWEDVSKDVAYY